MHARESNDRHHPSIRRLEVWRDNQREGAHLMVLVGRRSYMRSLAHKTSHARIPTDPAKARGVGLRRFTVVAS